MLFAGGQAAVENDNRDSRPAAETSQFGGKLAGVQLDRQQDTFLAGFSQELIAWIGNKKRTGGLFGRYQVVDCGGIDANAAEHKPICVEIDRSAVYAKPAYAQGRLNCRGGVVSGGNAQFRRVQERQIGSPKTWVGHNRFGEQGWTWPAVGEADSRRQRFCVPAVWSHKLTFETCICREAGARQGRIDASYSVAGVACE